ncbi:MAG TPA: glycine cleavage system aminomethyltransferase GcvT [Thermoflexales bacterium]|nr:glycine cleavage system aminomethyltransferase GcvT [Thermoflexales bacterium]
MAEELKRTSLYETHKQLGARMVPFGGWDMPVWYSSVKDEHAAVRNNAGLFDVSHMGVLDARGPNAAAFLDLIGTNDVSKLAVGKSQYAYMLDDDGACVDDIMIYRVEPERYLVVVNASNNDKDWAWLQSAMARDGAPKCDLRDLRAPSSGDDMRVDIALQGPDAQKILIALMNDQPEIALMQALPYAGIMRAKVNTFDVFISRTGYTGERVAYEIFVHPAQVVELWNAILAVGKATGVKPCGLASRDSLRTEAGLPLYGHELAGEMKLLPYHIGFANFVKTGKAANFIGRTAYMDGAAKSKMTLQRFRLNDKGVRVPKGGDPILDKKGRVIGTITSCAADSDGYLLGLAMIDNAANVVEGSAVGVLALPERAIEPLKPFAAFGSRALVPDGATIISRFPPKK